MGGAGEVRLGRGFYSNVEFAVVFKGRIRVGFSRYAGFVG